MAWKAGHTAGLLRYHVTVDMPDDTIIITTVWADDLEHLARRIDFRYPTHTGYTVAPK